MIRVVYLASTLRRAGPTSQLLNILRHLERDRVEPVVVTLSPEPGDSMLDQFRGLGLPVRTLGMSRLRAFAHRRWRGDIARLVGARLEDRCVVHSQGVRADVIASRWLAGLPRVATARNFPYDDYPLKFGRLPGLWMARAHMTALQRLPTVVACSSTLANQLREHGVEAQLIRNGVDTSRFHVATPEQREAMRALLGLRKPSRVGVSIGALSARKDPVLVVRAFRAIADPGIALVFVGDGPLTAECRRAAEGDSRIRFAGQVADVTPYLRSADFLVSASRSEGLPNAVIEAMACGLRVALSDIGPHRELLELAPSAGVAVAVGDVDALADGIACVARASPYGDPREALRTAEVLSAEHMSRSYQDLYRRLAGAGVAA